MAVIWENQERPGVVWEDQPPPEAPEDEGGVGETISDAARALVGRAVHGLDDEMGADLQAGLMDLANRFPRAAAAVGVEGTQYGPQDVERVRSDALWGNQKDKAEALDRSPVASFVGDVTGGIGRDAILAYTGLGMFAVPAVSGGISGAGDSTASLEDDPAGLAVDTGIGAGTGYLAGKAGELIGKGLRRVGGGMAQKLAGEENAAWQRAVASQDEAIASAEGRAGKQAQEAVGGRFNYEEAAGQAGLPPPRTMPPPPAGVGSAEWEQLRQQRLSNAAEKMRDYFDNPVDVPRFNPQLAAATAKDELARRSAEISARAKRALASLGARAAGGYWFGGPVGALLGTGTGGSAFKALFELRNSPAFLAKWSQRLMVNPARWGRAGVLLSQALQSGGPGSLKAAFAAIFQSDPEFAQQVLAEETGG